MKFLRNDLNGVKESREEQVSVEVNVPDVNIAEPEEVPVEIPVEIPVTVAEAVQPIEEVQTTEAVFKAPDSELVERFKIPSFEPKAKPFGFARIPLAEKAEVQSEKIVEVVNEVPFVAKFASDNVAFSGHYVPVENAEEHPSEPKYVFTAASVDTFEPEQAVTEEDEGVTGEELEKTPETEEILASVSWEKFVDAVIIPTLLTCFDRTKDFVLTNLAADLKKSNPDLK